MIGRKFLILSVLVAGLSAPRVRAGEPVSCATLERLRESATVARAGDGLLAENLYSYFCWDPMARFDSDQAQLPAFVSVYLRAPEPAAVVEEEPIDPPTPPRNGPNDGGGGGRAY